MQRFKEGDRVAYIPTDKYPCIFNLNGTVTGYQLDKVIIVFDEISPGFPYEFDESRLKLLAE